MYRRTTIIAISAFLALTLGSLAGWRMAVQHRSGWAGMSYERSYRELGSSAAALAALLSSPGEVSHVVYGGPAQRAGIRMGDTVESVNGMVSSDSAGLLALARSARPGETVTYTIRRNEETLVISVALTSPFEVFSLLAGALVSGLCGLAYLVISLLVLGARPGSREARVFYLLCVAGGAMFFLWAASEVQFPDAQGLAPVGLGTYWLAAWILVGQLVANLLLHLALVFPRPRPVTRRWPGVVGWLHLAPFVPLLTLAAGIVCFIASRTLPGTVLLLGVAAGILFALGRAARRAARTEALWRVAANRPVATVSLWLVAVAAATPLLVFVPHGAATVAGMIAGILLIFGYLAVALSYSVMTCVSLVRSYRESGVEQRRQLWWPIWGTTTALAGSLLLGVFFGIASAVNHIQVVESSTAVTTVTTGSKLFTLLIPLSFAFGIVKHRLMDIEIIVRKTVIYSAVTGIVVATYLALSGAAGLALVRWAGLDNQLATVMTTIAVVALLVPIRNRVQGFVDSRFFRRERRREKAARSLPQVIAAGANLEDLLAAVAEQVQQGLQGRSVVVFHRPRGASDLVAGATVGIPDRDRDQLLATGAAPTAIEKAAARPAWAVLAAPARSGGETVGLVAVGAPLGPEPYGPEDQSFLDTAATHLAAALAAREGREAEREFAQARVIQQGLLPLELPEISGLTLAATWQPAWEVGGDYYDALALGGRRLLVCIGDVSGKGMAAALLMSSLQAALRAVARPETGPAAICTQVRSVVCRSLSGGRFVTFFLAVVDPDAGTVTFTNAGHVPAILVRADGTSLRLEQGGPAMARVLETMPYAEHSVDLSPGARLLLATDGVTEAESTGGELFGEDRLLELVREHRHLDAAGLLDEITRSVEVFAGNRRSDDLTLVVIAA